MKLPLLKRLNRIPPYAYRLLAKTKSSGRFRELSIREIAQRSGLSRDVINRISVMHSWESVTIDTADRFIYGCGFNPFKQSRAVEMLRRISQSKRGVTGTRHLRVGDGVPLWEKASRAHHITRLKKVLESAHEKTNEDNNGASSS